MNTDSFGKLQNFFLSHQLFHYKKRETVLFTKDIPPGIFYISKGYIRSYLLSKDGSELTVTLLKPQDIFPMHWAINNVLTAHFYETLTEAELYRAPKSDFLQFVKNDPEVFFDTTSRILMRLNDASERMEMAILGNAFQKVSGMIIFLSRHLGQKRDKELVIDIHLTHKDIASLIGLARETVSLEMEKLEKQKIIKYKNHQIIVTDIEKLKRESNVD